MLSETDRNAIAHAAAEAGIEPAALAAVVTVESGGRAFARVGGRLEPLIRWEGHYFDRLCAPSVRQAARRAGLASPRAGAVSNPSSQAARWAMLRRAEALDRDAARQSASWGVGQVMGAHWQALGYGNVDALVTEARNGLAGQVRLMLRFIRWAGLLPALAAGDWPRFARGYNGPAYRRNGYEAKLRKAHAACRELAGNRPAPLLRRGACGPAVRALQKDLLAAGADIAADGVFGPATETALVAFQRGHGLVADGVFGPKSRAALGVVSRRDGAA